MSSMAVRRYASIDVDRLIRWSGLTLVLAGVLTALFPFAHPNHDPEGFRSGMWIPAHLMPNIAAVLALFGLMGLFLRQLQAAGWLGVVAFVASIIGTASFVSGLMIEAFMIPYMSLAFPELVLDDTPPPGIPEAFLVVRMLFMLGFLLVGAAVIRAKVFSLGDWRAIDHCHAGQHVRRYHPRRSGVLPRLGDVRCFARLARRGLVVPAAPRS